MLCRCCVHFASTFSGRRSPLAARTRPHTREPVLRAPAAGRRHRPGPGRARPPPLASQRRQARAGARALLNNLLANQLALHAPRRQQGQYVARRSRRARPDLVGLVWFGGLATGPIGTPECAGSARIIEVQWAPDESDARRDTDLSNDESDRTPPLAHISGPLMGARERICTSGSNYVNGKRRRQSWARPTSKLADTRR